MKLTGLQIFKYLPGGKKELEANCKKCGLPTCMAFAMKLAKGEISLDKCEHASDELKTVFEEACQLQQQEIVFGPKNRQLKVGNETVMFRHDKKFVNPACIAIKLESSDKNFDSKLTKIKNYSVERVGENFSIDAIALIDTDETFKEKAQQIAKLEIPLILASNDFSSLDNVLAAVKEHNPLVYLKNNNIEAIAEIQNKYKIPVIISGNSVEELANCSSSALDKGLDNIVLNLTNLTVKNTVQNLTYIRRSAIEDKFKPLGFPVITFQKDIEEFSGDPVEQGILGSFLICKYSNIVVLEEFNEAVIYAFITLRQNIYTDPEKPLQIESKVYPIGDTDENSPVIVTTNFALTYFTVAGEIESSNIPSYLVVTPSDGMSVLTAWSANKFNGEIIAKTFREYGVDKLVKGRKLIIPGYVSTLKEEIEEEMPEWEVIVGANEAVDIADFLKQYQNNYSALKA
ncbi:MAG TPA: acetyl-CoA decarbonylase/synthase complex subunit gamma [Candidatus Gastranaerophilales bacterium]|nr:acetyl-CoA decarbonylase/synthase complex subunit gamma [Candidatus Gastranaerophilales bacterium]